jgi:hypothetical protein
VREVELPDGSVGEFPDEMSDDAIAAVLRKQFPPTAAPAETAPIAAPVAAPVPTPAPSFREQVGQDYAPPKSVGEALLYAPGRLIGMPPSVQRGMMKGAANTVQGLGRAVASGFGRGELSPEQQAAFDPSTFGIGAQGAGEMVGKGAEQVGEFFLIPGPGKARGLARLAQLGKGGVASALLAKAQGASDKGAVVAGALNLLPIPVSGAARGLKNLGRSLVTSTIRPSDRLAPEAGKAIDFILSGVKNSAQAKAAVGRAEQAIQRVLSAKNPGTRAAQDAEAALITLGKDVRKAGASSEVAAAIQAQIKQLYEGSMGKTVTRLTPELKMKAVRVLREGVPAKEALESARASSRYVTGGKWTPKDVAEAGSIRAKKAVESAQRSAVKRAVPELAPLLEQEQRAILARKLLKMHEFRGSKTPFWKFLQKTIDYSGLPVGGFAYRLGQAIERNSPAQAAFILRKLGVAIPPAVMKPSRDEEEEE